MPRSDSKSHQGGGELSGLLRQAETLQREIDHALQELRGTRVEGKDPQGCVSVTLTGGGAGADVRLHDPNLKPEQRRRLEEALRAALRSALQKLFDLRRAKADAVARGMNLPQLIL